MKKTIAIIILSIITAISVISLLIILFLNIFKVDIDTKNEIKHEVVSASNKTDTIKEPKDLTMAEWKERISNFYEKNYNYKPDNVTCTEILENIIYVTIYHNKKMVAEYNLDAETGIALSPTEKPADFVRKIFLENLSTRVNFKNDECIAIGYIEKGKESQIREKYFNTDIEFECITTIKGGGENQFIVIPKILDATLKIWKYNILENGELYFEELLAEAKGEPLIITTELTEVFPRIGVEYEEGNTKFTVPLMLSGKDGKFVFDNSKNLIKDISIY